MIADTTPEVTSPRLRELLRMRRFLDAEIRDERQRFAMGSHVALIQAAADLYGTDPESVRSPSRNRSVVNARMVACWLLREAGSSYPEIGRAVRRDHSTAINACRAIDADPTRLALARGLLAQEAAA